MKVKSESEVAQLCPTLSDPMDCSPPGFSIHGIFQARVLAWGAIAFSASTGQGLLKRHSEVESLTRSLFFCFSVSISSSLNSFYSFSVSTMWIIQMAVKIEYYWYCIISENGPIRTSSADHRSFKVFGTRSIMYLVD